VFIEDDARLAVSIIASITVRVATDRPVADAPRETYPNAQARPRTA
jgi:hypothetical protein